MRQSFRRCLLCWQCWLFYHANNRLRFVACQSNDWTHPKLRRTREVQNVVPGEYIVVFHDNNNNIFHQIDAIGSQMLRTYRDNTHVKRTFDAALPGFAAELSAFALIGLLHDKRVDYIEENMLFSVSAVTIQRNASWGLDRIDQLDLPLDQEFGYIYTGQGVDLYIFDTGIRKEHVDFGGRASCSRDIVQSSNACNDGNGHGTHVAAIAGGTVNGVAKQANLKSVRVCDNAGSCSLDNIIAGFNHVIHQTGTRVINMSIQGSASSSLDSSILAAKNDGVVVVMAAGNSNINACNTYARSANALAVGAVDSLDFKASFSNYGSCVDLWAPGVSIVSAGSASNTANATMSGTSQASPFVAGAVATIMEEGYAGFSAVSSELLSRAVQGTLNNLRTGSPNLMLHLSRDIFISPSPSLAPSVMPTNSVAPSMTPTYSVAPSVAPSIHPSTEPSTQPSQVPTFQPSEAPTQLPSQHPSSTPTLGPTVSLQPSQTPSQEPSPSPTISPSSAPTTPLPSHEPSQWPSQTPSQEPTTTTQPSQFPTPFPSRTPSQYPTKPPSTNIVIQPTCHRVGRLCWSNRGCCPGHRCRQRRMLRFLAGNCQTW